MDSLIEQYRDVVEEYYHIYSEQLLASIPVISTTTYCLTILCICIPPIIALIFYEREQARLRAEQPKGCRKLGLKIESNLLNEYDRKFSEGRPPSTEETSAEWWRLKSLWIYPVKSCRGVELNRGTLIPQGMEYDRQFTFAQLRSPFPVAVNTPNAVKAAHKWSSITDKQFPLLSKVRTEMWVPDQSVDTYAPHVEDVESGGVIIISFPYQEPGWRGVVANWGAKVKGTVPEMHFRVPFDPSPVQIEKAGYSWEKMTVWKDSKVTALNMEIEIPDELRYYLGISNKLGLFRIDNSKLRSPKMEPDAISATGFQDAYPIHLVNLATIRALESTLPKSKLTPRLSAAKFRANLIITGPEAYHEDTWRRIKIGYYEYDVVINKRPAFPTAITQGGENKDDAEKKYAQEVEAGIHQLGMQLVPLAKEAAVRVGDEITVLEVAADDDESESF